MKKYLMILLGAILIVACIGLTACGGSGDGEQMKETAAVEEETAAHTEFYGGYGYMGDDPVEGTVYEYMATDVASQYEPEEDMVSIPVVYIVDRMENEDGSVDVAGEFEVYNYKVEGDTLKTQSGGRHPGRMHLVPDGDGYIVERFKVVEDGTDYESSARDIFGDKYEEFHKVSSSDETMNDLRKKTIANYVQATGIGVTQYQDEGWDPVKL